MTYRWRRQREPGTATGGTPDTLGNATIISGAGSGYSADSTRPASAGYMIASPYGGGYAIDTTALSGLQVDIVAGVIQITV